MRGKYVGLLLLLLVSRLLCYSQAFRGAVRDDTCACLTKEYQTKRLAYPDFRECLKNAMLKNSTLMIMELKSRYGDSADYQKGAMYGKEVGQYVDTALVYSCDAYFRVADSLRLSFFNSYDKDSVRIELAKLEKAGPQQTVSFHQQKASLSFSAGNYAVALQYAEAVLKADRYNVPALLVKGYTLESLKRYGEAAAVYYRLAAASQQGNYLVWAAIANRKGLEGK